mmetsp:Transcript_11388/g.22565  ORF Transcript_11388/g.22565 Transcript_11388/m.22565 type:complete len:356 (+) Transcript_11388:71-1138(+)|eukprot:CAMPEP_0194319934 /NCGR_PEP_ID=MMETSP0171-20130528/16329_1 /TAXON_ID=218684 /ORGANISM="Corethron pennatum, Strain L29A3" /LENGTH=355 /DNA_ID=CAMNT_0039077315 /DNA_START=35 /DNA_END=1102 /DNA_ORIENTATION=-
MTALKVDDTTGQVSKNSAATAEDDEVYDRQIRLWGVEAQSKISSASVLYVGVTAVATEVIKNLVLAGVRCTVADGRTVSHFRAQGGSSFLVPHDEDDGERMVADAVLESVRLLNPLLFAGGNTANTCRSHPCHISAMSEADVASHDVVICSGVASQATISLDDVRRVARISRAAGRKFILADTFGLDGCAVLDYGAAHEYRREAGKDKWSDPATMNYPPLADVLVTPLGQVRAWDRWYKQLPRQYVVHRTLMEYRDRPEATAGGKFNDWARSWLASDTNLVQEEMISNVGIGIDSVGRLLDGGASLEVPVVAAVLGGVLGQEIIKSITGLGEPSLNVMVFDGVDCGCKCLSVPSK